LLQYVITFDAQPSHADTSILWKGISENAELIRGLKPGRPFAFFIRDENNEIRGGCSGYMFYGCVYVDLIWVDTTLRGQGYGFQLMKKAEQLAADNNYNFIAVNTMDFEALNFYKKLGFNVEFERRGFEKNSIMYFLRKDIKTNVTGSERKL